MPRWNVPLPAAPFTRSRGVLRQFLVAAPGAGAEWSFTIPEGGWWRLRSAFATFTTSAFASQIPGCVISDMDRVVARVGSGFSVTANGGFDVTYLVQSPGVSAASTGTRVVVPVPNLFLQPGWKIGSATAALVGTDTYSSVNLYMEQLYEGQWAEGGSEHAHPHLEVDIEFGG